jgi:putative membrane protein
MSTSEPSNTPDRKGFRVPGWVLAVGGAVVLLVAAVLIGRAVRDDDGGGRRVFGEDGRSFVVHHGHPVARVLILLILIAAVVAGVVYLTRRMTARSDATKATSAEALLAERFARGEIDEADYRSRRDALRS